MLSPDDTSVASNSTRMSRRIHPRQNPPQNTLQNARNSPVSPQNPAIVLRTSNLQSWQPHPSNPRCSVVDSHDIETGASTSATARAHTIQVKQYTKKFNKLYDQYYRYNNVDQTLMDEVCTTEISMELFDKITLGKEYQNRIALIDGRVRLGEIPLKPHGEIVDHLKYKITQMLGQDLPRATFMGVADNGMISLTMSLIVKTSDSTPPEKSVPMHLGGFALADFPTHDLPGSRLMQMGSQLQVWSSRSPSIMRVLPNFSMIVKHTSRQILQRPYG
jgi:hypothetical protein